jgi:outer membrane lipoprotein-sorting protein
MSEIRRENEPRPVFRRPLIRAAAAAVAVAAIALSVLSVVDVFGANGPSIVAKAQAALEVSENTVLHFKVVSRENGDSSTTRSTETWQSTSIPVTMRYLETVSPGKAPKERQYDASGIQRIYDPETNTIYEIDRQTATDQQIPFDENEMEAIFLKFKEDALDLMESEDVKIESATLENGREVVRITSTSSGAAGVPGTYVIDAETGEPLQWQTGNGQGTLTMDITLEKLPATDENLKLMDLVAQHPDAKIRSDPAAFKQAFERLFTVDGHYN